MEGAKKYVGRTVCKRFTGGLYIGTVDDVELLAGAVLFHVTYADGDAEEFRWEELKGVMVCKAGTPAPAPAPIPIPPIAATKRVELPAHVFADSACLSALEFPAIEPELTLRFEDLFEESDVASWFPNCDGVFAK